MVFLKYNIGEIRDDEVKMVNYMTVKIEILKEYTANQGNQVSREEIYTAIIIYGFLSYYDGELDIPNEELMLEFQNTIRDDDFEYIAELV